MTHTHVSEECKALGLSVRRDPDTGYAASYSATGYGVRVYWRMSTISDTLIGYPRVAKDGRDTFARSLKEISYLVQR